MNTNNRAVMSDYRRDSANCENEHFRNMAVLAKTLAAPLFCKLQLHPHDLLLYITGLDASTVCISQNNHRYKRQSVSVSIKDDRRLQNRHIQNRRQKIEFLPYESDKFDAVCSLFGTLTAQDSVRAAAELKRVAKHDGQLGILCWVPDRVVGELLNLIAFTPELSEFRRRCEQWGTPSGVQSALGSGSIVSSAERCYSFQYTGPDQWLSFIYRSFLPVRAAYAALDSAGVATFTRDLLRIARQLDHSDGPALELPMYYLESQALARAPDSGTAPGSADGQQDSGCRE